ncbi:MAG: hypothetical protein M3T49_10720 [Candidatus Eremiobacteraeota bacterium]|nr:hypothetical protein [Candidatus Eremiobacteraeota bacterium]
MNAHHLVIAAAAAAVVACGGSAALAQDSAPGAATAPSASPSPVPVRSLDPCAMLTSSDVASAIGAAADQLHAPTRPSADECLWAIGARGATPARQVLLSIEQTQAAKKGCKGLQCLRIAQSVAVYIPGAQSVSSKVGTALSDAEMISGLGDKAGWKNGWLTVLKDRVVFRLAVAGAGSSSAGLAGSEALARVVLTRL